MCPTDAAGMSMFSLNTVYFTVKFLKIQTPEKFAVIILKVEQRGFTIAKCVQKM